MNVARHELLGDAELVRRCRGGDEAAWRELVQRYSRYVYAIAARVYRLGDHEAEDVFQETFVRVYEKLDRLRDEEALKPWIAQLVRRLCVDRLRASARERPDEDPPEEAALDERLARLDEALDLRAAMTGLNEPCQDILDRFFARDQSYHTIGAQLELPSGTIASRISRCLARLRQIMEDVDA